MKSTPPPPTRALRTARRLRPSDVIHSALLTGLLAVLISAVLLSRARAADPATEQAAPAAAPASQPARTNLGGDRKEIAAQLRDALGEGEATKKKLNLIIDGKSAPTQPAAAASHAVAPATAVAPTRVPPRGLVIRPRRVVAQHKPSPVHAPAHEVHWSYEGEGGPEHWGQLKPEYATCASGKRQSPIHIEEPDTLKGPAEAIQFNYHPSKGTVTNNGHTVQVNVYGDNTLTVRSSSYQLLQFHFHHPSEERINHQSYPMVAHLVHRNDLGQLAVVAVLLEEGNANPLIDKVWTYMPLDANDSVRMPPDLIDLSQLLPTDQRYYQFLGSLTTPPCTEGVLWMVLKQPVSLSRAQLRLFSQLYPHNARPVQPANGRPIRDAVQIPATSPGS